MVLDDYAMTTTTYIVASHETCKALMYGSHSFYLQTTPFVPLPHRLSPDGATNDCGHRHLIAAYYLFVDPDRMKG